MKNVLYIGNKPSLKDKTPTAVQTLGKLLQKEGYTLRTASSVKSKPLRLFDMCISVIRFRKVTDIVLIDTYSTQNFYYAVAVARICRFLKLPYIPILHGGNLPERLSKSQSMSKSLFGNAKCNVAPSGYLMNAFRQAGFHNLEYIPNTIELKNYPFLERSKVRPKLLWVRSFSKIYNPELALKVVEILQKKYPDTELCMVGPEVDGSLQDCREIVNRKNLNVRFTGKLSKGEWIELSKEYDIFINTTNIDNTPISVLEAMALGLPVVSTKVGGLPFLLEDRKDALLVPPGNPEQMAEAIERLLKEENLVKNITAEAYQKIKSFDWTEVKKKWHAVLG